MRNFRIFQNSCMKLVWKILREDVIFRIILNISEKCSNSYKNYEKNFHQEEPWSPEIRRSCEVFIALVNGQLAT